MQAIAPDWGPRAVTDWSLIAWQRRQKDEISFTAPVHYLALQFSLARSRSTATGSDRLRTYDASPGSFELIPAFADHKAQWYQPKDVAFFGFSDDALRRLACQEFDRGALSVELPRLGTVDPKFEQMSRLMRDQFTQGGCLTELYADALSVLMATHLVQTYMIAGRGKKWAPSGGLTPTTRRAVVDFMMNGINDTITIMDLACIARLSVGHFIRAFKHEFGVSPHRYLLTMRVQHVENLILTTDCSLVEAALASGFSSQSHMTVAFTRLRGMAPGRLRRHLA